MSKAIHIAIDGPAGSGKSTIAKLLAKSLKMVYLDTGAMYRAIGYWSSRLNINIKNSDEVNSFLNKINLKVEFESLKQRIFINGEEVTDLIRSPNISELASQMAKIPDVRIKLVDIQREIAKGRNFVLDGRDIGTYVLPDAKVKIYLNAYPQIRAQRRFNQYAISNPTITIEEVKEDIIKRDNRDKNRDFAPLKKADDAIEIDTSYMTIDKVVEKINQIIKDKL